METNTTTKEETMKIQEIINEGIKLGEALAGTSEVQARRIELNLTDEQAAEFWTAFHEARDKAYRTPSKRQGLTTEQKARAREIIKVQEEEILVHLKAKYQGRNELFGMKPVATSTLRKWAKTVDTRSNFNLEQALRQAGELY